MNGIEVTESLSTHAGSKKIMQNFRRKLQGKRTLLKPKRRRVTNVKVNILEVDCENVGWIHLAQVSVLCCTLVSRIMKLRVSARAGIC
jgi:hypothetical protein